jgi:hypothetical protein
MGIEALLGQSLQWAVAVFALVRLCELLVLSCDRAGAGKGC